MNWIKQNPFFTGLIVITVVVLGVLGFLLAQEQAAYAQVTQDFQTSSTEANRLQNLKPYPDQKNLQAGAASKEAYKSRIEAFQKELAGTNLPIVPLAPNQFQDKLRQLHGAVEQAAHGKRTALPQDFYLGFEKYRELLPGERATGRLNQQLDAIDTVVKLLIDRGVTEIKSLKRVEIPEEGNGQTPEQLVTKTAFTVEFRADHERMKTILNDLVAMKKPFLIIRNIKIVNDKVDGPQKVQPGAAGDPAAAGAPPAGEAPAAGATPAPQKKLEVIFGAEKDIVTLDLEVATFAEGSVVAQPTPKGPAPRRNP